MDVVASKGGGAYIDPVLLFRARFDEAGEDLDRLLAIVDELTGLGQLPSGNYRGEVVPSLSALEVRARVKRVEEIAQREADDDKIAELKAAVEALPQAYDFRNRVLHALKLNTLLPN